MRLLTVSGVGHGVAQGTQASSEGKTISPAWGKAREGGSELYLPRDRRAAQRGPAARSPVFYNPAMALSRDLTIAVVAAFAEERGHPLRAWDALSATGVRAVRLLRETRAMGEILCTELHPEALQLLRANARDWGGDAMVVEARDARSPPPQGPFDLVDLDPYGTPAPFLEAALRSLSPGGLLAVTATDMAVLAGPERSACERRYGARPLRTYLCREAGLRILLGAVRREALRWGLRADPILSYAHDYYVRAFLRILPARGEDPLPLRSIPFEGYEGPPLPSSARGGPLWTGPLCDERFLEGVKPAGTSADLQGATRLLEILREESGVHALFHYEMGEEAKRLHLSEPPSRGAVLEALRASGWKSARTHVTPSGWRTEAPPQEVARILKGLDRR